MPSPGPPVSNGLRDPQIRHVVFVVQENRSFDNLFQGYPGADTVAFGTTHDGKKIRLHPTRFEDGQDIGHYHYSFLAAYDNGRNDGFDEEHGYGIVHGKYMRTSEPPTYPYAYVPRAQVTTYFDLAKEYVLADRMFQSNSGPSFPAHLYLVAGQSGSIDEVPSLRPWGCDAPKSDRVAYLRRDGLDQAPGVYPCFDFRTITDELDAKHLSWRYYIPPIETLAGSTYGSAFDAIRHVRFGPDFKREVSPETTIFSDLKIGALPNVSWVVPTMTNSDHPQSKSATGPDWVATVVNAIGRSPQWRSTAIFVVWDDWGGWYDHVVPPQLDPMGLGYRVPLLVISPYAKRGYVSHVQHEFGSMLRFTEETFGLDPLSLTDSRADDLRDCFTFGRAPRAFHFVRAAHDESFFLLQPPSDEPNDQA
jgi:phospholipase C